MARDVGWSEVVGAERSSLGVGGSLGRLVAVICARENETGESHRASGRSTSRPRVGRKRLAMQEKSLGVGVLCALGHASTMQA